VPCKAFAGDRGLAAPTRFSWRGGTPTANASAQQGGLYTAGKVRGGPRADGFEVEVQLSAGARGVRVYVGSDDTAGLLNATLLGKGGALTRGPQRHHQSPPHSCLFWCGESPPGSIENGRAK
jgi:hypothetical protein